jgi:hypothetical protein
VAHAGATAPGLIRCTTPHTAAVICTTASTQHPPPGGVRGKAQSARRLRPRWAPSPCSPNNQQATSPCYNQLSHGAWQCPSGRILVVLRELALAREREGRKRPLPYIFHASFLLWWEARPKILETCGAGACFVAFSTIRFALAQAGSKRKRCDGRHRRRMSWMWRHNPRRLNAIARPSRVADRSC